jgi:hypothetical protein
MLQSNTGHLPLAFFQYVLACTSKSILPKAASCKKKSPLHCEKLNLVEISLRFQLYWVSYDAAVWTSSKKGLEAI